jgi:zinc protease
MQEPQLRALFGESRYADRLPIGSPEVLKSFPPSGCATSTASTTVRIGWRSSRSATVDPDAIEARSSARSSDVSGAPPAADRAIHPVPPHDGHALRLGLRSRSAGFVGDIVHKRCREPLRTVGDYRRSLVRSLVHQMINARFAELAREPDAPFRARRVGRGRRSGGRSRRSPCQARVNDGGLAAV